MSEKAQAQHALAEARTEASAVTEDVKAKDVKNVDRHIGLKLESIRQSFGISRTHLAEKVGITHQQLQKYEKGINRISIGRLYDITQALGIAMHQLFLDIPTANQEQEISPDHEALGLQLLTYFQNIDDAEQKKVIVDLVRTLAGE